MTQITLHPAIEQLVCDIAAMEGVRRVILFGSRARGDNAPRADVDLAVDAPDLTDGQWYGILGMVENARTLLKIDCVHLNKQDGLFLKNILDEGKVLYERKDG
ncbi:MAG: nucleotidyltransferase domain-containing protein [Alphaproteobacteria bacterium]